MVKDMSGMFTKFFKKLRPSHRVTKEGDDVPKRQKKVYEVRNSPENPESVTDGLFNNFFTIARRSLVTIGRNLETFSAQELSSKEWLEFSRSFNAFMTSWGKLVDQRRFINKLDRKHPNRQAFRRLQSVIRSTRIISQIQHLRDDYDPTKSRSDKLSRQRSQRFNETLRTVRAFLTLLVRLNRERLEQLEILHEPATVVNIPGLAEKLDHDQAAAAK
jgi:hypothetical protein